MTSTTQRSSLDMSVLSNLDRLILAQAVYELGANSWSAVAKLLSKHPLLSRPKTFFTAQSCHVMYNYLMREADFDCTEANNATRAPANLRLAQRHYQARFQELRGLIIAEEVKFKTLAAEIDDIRSGLWDDKITTKVTGGKPSPETTAAEPSSIRENTPDIVISDLAAEEISAFDLSSITKSGSPPPQTEDDIVNRKDSTPPPEVTNHIDSEEPVLVNLAGEPTPEGCDSPRADAEFPEFPGVPLPMGLQSAVEQEADQIFEKDLIEVPPFASSSSPPNQAETVSDRGSRIPEDQGTDEVLEDDGGSSGDEPLHATRQAVRARRSVSSVTLPHMRSNKPRQSSQDATLSRQQERAQGTEASPTQDDREASIMEIDDQGKVNTPLMEDDRAASPATPDIASLRRRESKRKASFVETESRDKKRAREESEPVDEDEPGPARRRRATGEQVALKRFQYVIGMLHSQISQHRSGNIFHNPIKNSEAPDYHEIVKRPIDLKTIKARVKDGAIANSLEYQRDVYLMFANALMYNRPGSDIYHMAENMMLESEGYIHTFRQTEGFVRGTHGV